MCSPFFSVMPFLSAQLHSFSHVRYTLRCYANSMKYIILSRFIYPMGHLWGDPLPVD